MRLAAKLLVPPIAVLTLVAGLWFLGAVVASTTQAAIGLGFAWFAVCCLIAWRAGRARTELRLWLGGTLLACALAGGFGFWWTTIRETEVDEPLVTGVPASRLPASDRGATDPLAPQAE